MNKSKQFSSEVRERAVRLVQEHRGEYPSLWAAVESIAPKIGCVPSTLLAWLESVLRQCREVQWFGSFTWSKSERREVRFLPSTPILTPNSRPLGLPSPLYLNVGLDLYCVYAYSHC